MKPRPTCQLLVVAALLSAAPAVSAQDLTRYALGGNNQTKQLVNAPDGSLFAIDEWASSNNSSPSTGYVLRIATDGSVTRLAITHPTTVTAGPDGNMWVAEPDRVHRITPALVETLLVPLCGSTCYIRSLAAGPDGNVWALMENDHYDSALHMYTYHPELAAITLSGTVTNYPLPAERYTNLITGPDGELWCSHEFPDGSHAVTTISTSGQLTDVPVSVGVTLSGKIASPDGTIWGLEAGYTSAIVQVATDGTVLASYPLSSTNEVRLAIGPDGNLWYVSDANVGKIVPADDAIWTFTDTPASGCSPGYAYIHTGIAAGSDGKMWVVEQFFCGVPPPATLGRNVAATAAPVSNGQYPTVITFDTSVAMTQRAKPNSICNFDGDYTSDLFWRNSVTGDNAIWYLRGVGGQNTPIHPVPNVDWTIAGSGDFDGDGHADLLWRDTQTGYTAVWLEAGGDFTNVPGPMVSLDWTPRVVGDVDGDGKADVVWRSTATGDNAIWLMNGGAHTNMPLPSVPDTEWSIRGAADLDGDGVADLFWKRSTGETSVWYMDAALSHSNVSMSTVGPGWEPVAVGKALVFWRNSATLQLAYWQMASNRTIQGNYGESVSPSFVKDASWSVAATGDFFGFGHLDLVWRRNSGEMVVWHLSQGYFIQEYRLATVSDPDWRIVTPR
jgi:hypothetical protein